MSGLSSTLTRNYFERPGLPKSTYRQWGAGRWEGPGRPQFSSFSLWFPSQSPPFLVSEGRREGGKEGRRGGEGGVRKEESNGPVSGSAGPEDTSQPSESNLLDFLPD